MSKLIVILRVKDGIFYIHDWLSCYEKIADELIVLDNGSTDGTYEALQAHPKVSVLLRSYELYEARDKTLMYAHARERKADWCLWVDVDEVFEPELTRADFNRLMNRRHINKYGFRRFHFIDREYFAGSWFRLNYSSGHDRMMWRVSPSDGYFPDMIFDCPNIKGIKGLKWNTNFRLKHMGYINKEIVDKKADFYRIIVPEKEATVQTMYMRKEKPIRWIDSRKNHEVLSLNMLLSFLQIKNFLLAGPGKLWRRLFHKAEEKFGSSKQKAIFTNVSDSKIAP